MLIQGDGETADAGIASKDIWTFDFHGFQEVEMMHSLIHTLFSAGFLLAGVITLGVGVLLFCCVGCTRCPGKEQDDLFRHRSA